MVNDPLKTLIEIDKKANSTDLIKIHRRRCIADNKCANCNLELGKEHTEDEEYKIQALCLECQKEFFKDEEADLCDYKKEFFKDEEAEDSDEH